MKTLKVIFGLYAVAITLILANAAMAVEGTQNGEHKQMREERRKKFLEEKCHGDSACEAQMKQKFEEKRAKIQEAMNQCAQGDEACRKEVRQKMIREFKEKRQENQKNPNVK